MIDYKEKAKPQPHPSTTRSIALKSSNRGLGGCRGPSGGGGGGSILCTKGINVAFKEPIYKILECIKNKPYFRWLEKMGGDSAIRNQSLYCTYHREKGHTTEQCHVLKDHLKQLVKARHLKEFIVGPEGVKVVQGSGNRGHSCNFLGCESE